MNRAVGILLSIYIALVIYANAFFIKQLTLVKDSDQLFWNHLAIFAILVFLVSLAIKGLISADFSRGGMRVVRMMLVATATLGLLISIFYHVIPIDEVYDMPALFDKYFSSDTAFTVWLIIPVIALFI